MEISSCLVYVTVVVLFQPAAIIFTYTAMTRPVFLLKLGYTKTKEGMFSLKKALFNVVIN